MSPGQATCSSDGHLIDNDRDRTDLIKVTPSRSVRFLPRKIGNSFLRNGFLGQRDPYVFVIQIKCVVLTISLKATATDLDLEYTFQLRFEDENTLMNY